MLPKMVSLGIASSKPEIGPLKEIGIDLKLLDYRLGLEANLLWKLKNENPRFLNYFRTPVDRSDE